MIMSLAPKAQSKMLKLLHESLKHQSSVFSVN